MNVFLMHPDRDFSPPAEGAWDRDELAKDLALPTLWHAMAADDEFLYEVAGRATFGALTNDAQTIRYRHAVLRDCQENTEVIDAVYQVALSAIEEKGKSYFGILSMYPSAVLHGAREVMEIFVRKLRELRLIAEKNEHSFSSDGFRRLFSMLKEELSEEYLGEVERHLAILHFRRGVLLSASLGKDGRGIDYVVRLPNADERPWWRRLIRRRKSAFTFEIPERDDAGAQALNDIQGRGINSVANALAQSMEHILGFFVLLRTELAFYRAQLNLQRQLGSIGARLCVPTVAPAGSRGLRFDEMYDVCLALQMGKAIVGNRVDATGRSLVMITGANQGGKSSFLRSVGISQLMFQAGMLVGADQYESELFQGLFTHYKREEDAGLDSGKFDEEVSRMSRIAKKIVPNSMLLCNESFAATNEREGSAIAHDVIRAMLDKGIRVLFVTHFYHLARSVVASESGKTLFLRAPRNEDGTRSFRLIEGAPLETSFGDDLYRRIFGEALDRDDEPTQTGLPVTEGTRAE
ncbi:DNA mismatch repair protein MutS [Pandoraea eparura]|uniref:DNA mismatch repair protein MutS n=1 Tax=Pandoraea eparura TaxID=2508291 RepID=A0A5E4XLR3_9BURK|nr:DNA mismatch repair protein MutS [Pandoraea eparura]VVE37257.1 DNA mismatch repair protein MutS [Pandoraea eparura]